MKKTLKLVSIIFVLLILSTAVFAACKDKTEPVDTVIVGTTAVIEKAVRGEYDYDMLASGNSEIPLVYQDAEGVFHPLLADYSTEYSKSWTFTVKDDMKWSDGKDVTAEDILFTLQYADESENATNFVGSAPKYAGYSLSEDKKSVTLELSKANVRELSNMTSFRVMPKHIYENKSAGEITEADGRVVCGPYVLTSFNVEANSLTYEINPYYPQKPNVTKLVYKLFSSADVMYAALKTGDVDAVWTYSSGIPSTYLNSLKNSNLTFMTGSATNAPAVLMFNNSIAPFNDVNIRLAVSYALNYETFKSLFGSEYAKTPNKGFAPEGTVGYKETEPLETDFAKAEEYLVKSGYTKGKSGFYEKSGEVLSFGLTVRATNATHIRYAEVVKICLEQFGIKVNIDALDGTAFNVKTSNKFAGENNTTVSHQAAINGFTSAGMGMMNGLGSIYVDKNHAVQGGCQVSDAAFQEILTEMSAAKTPEEYVAGAGKLQDYYAEKMPLIALYRDNMLFAYNSRLSGFVIDAVFGINNVNSWLSVVAAK